jgi:cell division septation protein DedD
MGRGDDEQEWKQEAGSRDTELTLGGGLLLLIGCGLILLCGVCFGIGYAVGHQGAASPVAKAEPAAQPSLQPGTSAPKPMAAGQSPQSPTLTQQPPAATDDSSVEGSASAQSSAQVVDASANAASTQAQVKPALQVQTHPALPAQAGAAQPAPALQVQPAFAQPAGWMVQIAAVSRPEDAEVLVNALRKHGYVVAVRREVSDSLIHVQTGPFVNRNDANAMRQKLLNDGYNAIVQQ